MTLRQAGEFLLRGLSMASWTVSSSYDPCRDAAWYFGFDIDE